MDKVKIGIIGIGKMGSSHAARIFKNKVKTLTLSAVCDIDEKRQVWASENLSTVTFYKDYHDMLNDKNVDAIIVATPHYLHPTIAIEAMKAGKHVLIEKPCGVFTKQVAEMNKEASLHKNLVFAIMYNQRTNPLYIKAKEIVSTREFGEIKRINWIITNWYRPQAYYDQGGWRGTWAGEGGGALINQCPHQLDLFQWLGGMPSKIVGFTHMGVNRNINVENDVTAYMEYPNGATGVFVTSTHDFPGTNRLEIDGDGGQIVIEKSRLTYTRLKIKESDFNRENKKFMPRIPSNKYKKHLNLLQQGYMLLFGQHMAIMKNFGEAILNNKPLIAPGVEGINGLTISNAIHLSGWQKKEIILPIDQESFLVELEKRKQEELQLSKK